MRIVLPLALVVITHTWLSLPDTFAELPQRPNIILCMADDQGWGDVSFREHPALKTPVLDEMAANGLNLNRFYAAGPVCSPTRGSVLTGRHPNRFGCFSWGHTLRPQERTIAEALSAAGYRTGHFGKWHLGSLRSESPVHPGASGFDTYASAFNFYENDPHFVADGVVKQYPGESSEATIDAALPFMRKAVAEDEPFLAVIWFGNPHTPHVPTKELSNLYPAAKPNAQKYYGEIVGIDRAMGKLRRELDSLNVRESTLVWYTSDNGSRPPGSTGGLRGLKGQLWEGGIRVPSILEWPGTISAAESDLLSGTVDIFPTVLEVAGVKVPRDRALDGVSLVPILRGEKLVDRSPLGFWDLKVQGRRTPSEVWMKRFAAEQNGGPVATGIPTDEDAGTIPEQTEFTTKRGWAAWNDGRFKLHRHPTKTGSRFELYDLDTDPEETTDLAEKDPARVKQMATALEKWQRSVLNSLTGADER